MEDYIYKRYCQAEQIINDELNACLKYRKAKDIDFKIIRERVLKPLQIKSFPTRYKEQITSILWFCFKREIHNKMLYPVLFEGKLYSKWDNMPEECREMLRKANSEEALKCRPYPVFTWHFTEGMEQ